MYLRAIEAGMKLITPDPRFTEVVRNSALWLQIRPGTDAALNLGIAHVLIEENLYDKEFVEKWCYGFEQLKERVKNYTPEKVEEITWVPADKIREAARTLANNKPQSVPLLNYGHTEPFSNSWGINRSRHILPALLGTVDEEAGETMPSKPKWRTLEDFDEPDIMPMGQRKKFLNTWKNHKFGMVGWEVQELIGQAQTRGYWKGNPYLGCTEVHGYLMTPWNLVTRSVLEGKPYPIKAFIGHQGSALRCGPNQKQALEALKQIEFYVNMDTSVMTPDAMMADYVLPAASTAERPMVDLMISNASEMIFNASADAVIPKKIPGLWDHKEDYEMWREFTKAIKGQKWIDEHWPQKNYYEHYEWVFKPAGMTLKEVAEKTPILPILEPRRYALPDSETGEPRGFGTPSGKVELYSTIAEKVGCDPMGNHTDPAASPYSTPDIAAEYPFILTTGARHGEMFHGELFEISMARKIRPDPIVQIHPMAARQLGIAEHDWVWIETPTGKIRMRAKHYEGLDPKVIACEHGWWFPEESGELPNLFGVSRSNASVLVDDDPLHCDPATSVWANKAMLCKVYKAPF